MAVVILVTVAAYGLWSAWRQARYDAALADVDAYLKQDDLARALASAERLVELRPDSYHSWWWLGRVHRRKRDNVPAEEAFRKAIASAPAVAGLHAGLGRALAMQQMPSEAAAEYRRAAKLQPDSSHYIAKTVNLFVVSAQPAAAVEFLRGIEEDVPESLSLWLSARLAWALIYEGETAQARERLLQIAESAPDQKAQGALAPCWMYLGEWQRALQDLDATSQGTEAQTLGRPTVLALSGDLEESEELLRALVDVDDRAAWAKVVLAYTLAMQAQPDEAQRLLNQVEEPLAWQHAALEPLYLAGLAYRELGDTEKSNELFQRAIERWPKHPWSEKMRSMMQ
ncbi:MAG: tetratricopeptide repeat protein [Armatimonadota bacterium]